MEVLLVEDNPADQMLAQQAFKDANTPCTLNIVADGEQAMMYLRNIDQYKNANRPKLILLDLNMPKMDGHEVLEAVKTDPELAGIPVVILTTSSNPKDVKSCYAAHANSYVRKPADMNEFTDAVRNLEHYWFDVVSLP